MKAQHTITATLGAAALALGTAGAASAGTEAPLKVTGQEALRGAKTVTVGAFNVGFIFESVDQTKATGGLMGAFGGATKAQSELVGVTPEMMQTVADRAYADFVQQLGAAGFAVQDPAVTFAAPALVKPHGQPAPADVNIALEKGSKGKATYVKPAALPVLIFLPGDFTGSGMSSIGMNMAAGQASGELSSYARQSGIPVIDVTYLIDFSDQKRPGAFSFGGLEVNANLAVSSGFSRMTVLGANGKTATVTFKQGVSVDGDFVERRDTTSGTSKTTQAAANVAGGVAAAFGFGGMRFGKTRKFAFTAKPGSYETGAVKAASLANTQLVGVLQSSR
ncbi:MAG: hypothetical protein ACKOQ3_14965 [Novosphingobium sp.]